jgi:hypothetical protein
VREELGIHRDAAGEVIFDLLDGIVLGVIVQHDDVIAWVIYPVYGFQAFQCVLPTIPVEDYDRDP